MEEAGIIGQLGINWKLFLSQAVNFFILLIVLRAFVYKPLIQVIEKRNKKIKEGLEKAEEADVRLK
ncbi:MAG: ATP synthase F0 subunit B, partial [Patescibacteria group bacterium]